jgi:hypothetical protein
VKIKVEGAAAKIDAIFRFDKELWREMQREIKSAADMVASDARGRVPNAGIMSRRSGFTGWGKWISASGGRVLSYDAGAVRGGIKARARSRSKSGFREARAQVDMTTPAGAIFALAGSRNRSGHPFNTTINRQHGGSTGMRNNQFWPRLLTPARYAKGSQAAEKIGQAIERGISKINGA